jgi:hypothetical protein
MTTFYKIRHKPTGLFFKPGAGYSYLPNVSVKGKVYHRKPTLKYLGKTIKFPPVQSTHRLSVVPVVLTDWEIVTYNVVETIETSE